MKRKNPTNKEKKIQNNLSFCALREGGALLQDNAGTGRTEPVQLFLFNTCLLICRRSDKVGKWDLRVLMRMNVQNHKREKHFNEPIFNFFFLISKGFCSC
jgi:hypothetical protein